VIKATPVKSDSRTFLGRGIKTKSQLGELNVPDVPLKLDDLLAYGATLDFMEAILNSAWQQWLPEGVAERFAKAVKKYGLALALEPNTKVGTIHSVKGDEADHVVLLTSLTKKCHDERNSGVAGVDSEKRVAYVGATRARKTLQYLVEEWHPYRMDIPMIPQFSRGRKSRL
jgi:superfamily I DNA/RNA helicase